MQSWPSSRVTFSDSHSSMSTTSSSSGSWHAAGVLENPPPANVKSSTTVPKSNLGWMVDFLMALVLLSWKWVWEGSSCGARFRAGSTRPGGADRIVKWESTTLDPIPQATSLAYRSWADAEAAEGFGLEWGWDG